MKDLKHYINESILDDIDDQIENTDEMIKAIVEKFINEIDNEEFDGEKIKLENNGDFILNNEWFNNKLKEISNGK